MTLVPVISGDINQWVRQAAEAVNELSAQNTATIFTWNKGCLTVPTSTTISGAVEIFFQSQFTGNGTLVITVFDAEGGVNVALNGVELGALAGAAGQEILYEVAVTNLVEGDDPLNVFKIWSTSADTAELRKLEVYRNFTKEQISDSAIWGNITGVGKPEDDATNNVGALADLDTVDTAQIDNDAITNAKIDALAVDTAELAASAVETDKVLDDAITKQSIAENGSAVGPINFSGTPWTDIVSIVFTKDETSSGVAITAVVRAFQNSTFGIGRIRVLRDTTDLKQVRLPFISSDDVQRSLEIVDSPAAGTFTYKVQIIRDSGTGTVNMLAGDGTLKLQEFKK